MSLEFDEAIRRHKNARGPACSYNTFVTSHPELAEHVARHLDGGTPATVIADTLKGDFNIVLGAQAIRRHHLGRCACE